MNAADRRRLTPVLGIACALFALLLVALWAGAGRGVHWHDNASPAQLPPLRAAPPGPEVPPLQNFADVWERPLFSPDRKPIVGPADSDDGANGNNLDLTGVILLPGLRMALLRDRTTGRTLRVREGQSDGGATVIEVKPRSAVVEANGSRMELALKPGPAPAGSAGDNPAAPGADMVESAPEDTASRPQPPQPASPMAAQARARMLKQQIDQRRRQAEARARLQQQQQQHPPPPQQQNQTQDPQQPE